MYSNLGATPPIFDEKPDSSLRPSSESGFLPSPSYRFTAFHFAWTRLPPFRLNRATPFLIGDTWLSRPGTEMTAHQLISCVARVGDRCGSPLDGNVLAASKCSVGSTAQLCPTIRPKHVIERSVCTTAKIQNARTFTVNACPNADVAIKYSNHLCIKCRTVCGKFAS